MAKRKRLNFYRGLTSLLLGAFELLYVIAISAVLYFDPGECNTPIRTWLLVLFLVFLSHVIVLAFSEIFVPCCSIYLSGLFSLLAAILNSMIGLFFMVWFVLGNIWYYSANGCEDDFTNGYTLAFVLLIIHYSMLGLGCCLGAILLILVCVGSGLTTRARHY